MMAKLKIVNPEDAATEISMASAIEGVLRQCIADSPGVVLVVWEAKGQMSTRTLPDSVMVQKGFVHTLNEMLFKRSDDYEEVE